MEKGAIVGGNPAKLIKTRNNIDELDQLVKQEAFYIKKLKEDNLVRQHRKNYKG